MSDNLPVIQEAEVRELVKHGNYVELLEYVAGAPQPAPVPPPEVVVPLTPTVIKAMETFPDWYGAIAPDGRRELVEVEKSILLNEWGNLSLIENQITKRKAQIREMVFHHLDVETEASQESAQGQAQEPTRGPQEAPGDDETRETDSLGHYLRAGVVEAPGMDYVFTREVRTAAPRLSTDGLLALVESGELEHDEYLQMTRQVREVSPEGVLEAVRKSPKMVHQLRKVILKGTKVNTFHRRKKKV